MKYLTITLLIYLIGIPCYSQMVIEDKAIRYQQERMVFKQWDEDKFYPLPNRFLGIPTNPLWYLTWGLHPDYPNTDRRPLDSDGQQTQRLSLAAAMEISSNYYKEHSDTVKNIAVDEMTRISGALSSGDPLYFLYYQKELKPLENFRDKAFLNTPVDVSQYMTSSGSFDWYIERMSILNEKFEGAKSVDLERGQRILMYHRIMLEMRKVLESWEYKKKMSEMMLAYKEQIDTKRFSSSPFDGKPKTDSVLIEEILNKKKVLK